MFAELKSASSQAGKKSKGKTQFPGRKSRAVSKGVVKPTVKPSQGQIALGGATVSVPLAWFILPLRRALSAPIKPSSARPCWHPCFASMAFLMQALYVNSQGCVGVNTMTCRPAVAFLHYGCCGPYGCIEVASKCLLRVHLSGIFPDKFHLELVDHHPQPGPRLPASQGAWQPPGLEPSDPLAQPPSPEPSPYSRSRDLALSLSLAASLWRHG